MEVKRSDIFDFRVVFTDLEFKTIVDSLYESDDSVEVVVLQILQIGFDNFFKIPD